MLDLVAIVAAYRLGHAVGAWERHDAEVADGFDVWARARSERAAAEARREHEAPLREDAWLPSTHPDNQRRRGLL